MGKKKSIGSRIPKPVVEEPVDQVMEDVNDSNDSNNEEINQTNNDSDDSEEEVQESKEVNTADSNDDDADEYTAEEQKLLSQHEQDLENTAFSELDLDSRLLQALALLKLVKPTPIQAKAIPLALGLKKDIIGRAKTGSGKTVAYAIPIVESILQEARNGASNGGSGNNGNGARKGREGESINKHSIGNRAIVLVPSRELADQVTKLFKSLTIFADQVVGVVNVSQHQSNAGNSIAGGGNSVMVSLLAAKPAIVVGTPARVLEHVQSGSIDAASIAYLVIDEADLVLSYGFRDDLDALASLLPVKKTVQTWLMSATMGEDIQSVKSMFCRKNLAVLKVEDGGDMNDDSKDGGKLLQYYVKTSEIDKFLLTYVIFKLKLIRGKTLIFVNNTERCYQLKLFLEQFGIRSIVLNSELPIASRLHIVEQFNRNVYDLLIATDEDMHAGDEEDEEEGEEGKGNNEKNEAKPRAKKNKNRGDKEFSVSRGVDFRNVACVVNFDLPPSSTVYTHRIGRTARANKAGMSLSFVVPRKDWRKDRQASVETAKKDEKILARIMKQQEKRRRRNLRRNGVPDWETSAEGESNPAVILQPYVFDMKQMESFRYRMEGAFKAVTKIAIREARLKEIRQELLASEKLKRHFEENPEDLAFLRHDKESHAASVQTHLKRVPTYLLPPGARNSMNTLQPNKFIGARKSNSNRIRKQRRDNNKGKGRDPLKTFKK